jgi:hypothetical protein
MLFTDVPFSLMLTNSRKCQFLTFF